MNFDLTRPCEHCPFRRDIAPYLQPERVLEIVMSLERKTFACHVTVHGEQPREQNGRYAPKPMQHCGGALVVMAKGGHFGAMQQIAMRFGIFEPENLDLNAPVFANVVEMLRANEINPEEHDCYWLRESQRGEVREDVEVPRQRHFYRRSDKRNLRDRGGLRVSRPRRKKS